MQTGSARGNRLQHWLALALWALATAAPAQPLVGDRSADHAAAPLAVTQVAPGVFVHIGLIEDWLPGNGGDVANLGFVVGGRCVAVIDSGGTPEIGRRLRAAVTRVTPLPVCYVINTHAHPDHVLGNVAFLNVKPDPKPGAASASTTASDFVAAARFGPALAPRAPYYLNALQRDFGITLPREAIIEANLSVERSLELDLGDRSLTLQAWPSAHTDNDLTVYDRKSRTLFASDLLFVGHLPVLDGKLLGWLAVLTELRRLDVAVAVPGHGPVSSAWPAVMDAQSAYLTMLLSQTRAALKNKLTIQQTVDSIVSPADAPWSLVKRFHRRNVTAAYAELEWEE